MSSMARSLGPSAIADERQWRASASPSSVSHRAALSGASAPEMLMSVGARLCGVCLYTCLYTCLCTVGTHAYTRVYARGCTSLNARLHTHLWRRRAVSVRMCTHMSLHRSAHRSVHMSIRTSERMPTHMSTHMSIRTSKRMSTHTSVAETSGARPSAAMSRKLSIDDSNCVTVHRPAMCTDKCHRNTHREVRGAVHRYMQRHRHVCMDTPKKKCAQGCA